MGKQESKLSKEIIDYLRLNCGHKNVGKVKISGIRGWKDKMLLLGVPDILAYYKVNKTTTFELWIETKATTKQSDEQVQFEKNCKNVCGVRYILAYSLNDVIKVIKEVKE